jgi:hypothetical protein
VGGGLTVGGPGTGVTVVGVVMVGVVMVVAGIALLVVGALGRGRRLPRNRFAGVRTAATLRDDETFAVGNQVSAPLTITAGAVAVVAAAASMVAPTATAAWVLAGLGLGGMLVLTLAGGVLGDRAARLAAPADTLGGCTGTCSGCSLVAGCGGNAGGGGAVGGAGGGS